MDVIQSAADTVERTIHAFEFRAPESREPEAKGVELTTDN